MIEVVKCDITKLTIDAIVNAANETLLGGGGVDGAIHRAAGPKLLEVCLQLPDKNGVRCPTGEARMTPGFDLPAKFVIHTVGPIWGGGICNEPKSLAACYRNSLLLAHQHSLKSIAFPAISCGVYGYPIKEACKVAVNEIDKWVKQQESSIEQVILVGFDNAVKDALDQALLLLR